jgi:polyisoprenoid-binding protein YceI
MEGKFSVDTTAKAGSLEVTLHTASVATGDSERGQRARTRDEHLRTPDFFNSTEFPTMTYRSTAVMFDGDAPKTIEGNLTLLGVTKPVVLDVQRWKCGPEPRTKGSATCAGPSRRARSSVPNSA